MQHSLYVFISFVYLLSFLIYLFEKNTLIINNVTTYNVGTHKKIIMQALKLMFFLLFSSQTNFIHVYNTNCEIVGM